MPTYRLDILVTGTDRASGKLTGIRRALQRIFQIASGILIAGTIRLLSQQIFELGRTAIESYSNLERMQVSLQSLVARELARGDIVQETSSFIRHITESEVLAIDKLIVKYADLEVEMGELLEGQQGAIDEFGVGSIEALRYSIAIRELTTELGDTNIELERMQGLEGKLVTVTSESLVKTLSLADALGLAAKPAEELTDWIVRLSLRSPFSETDIIQALRVAAGYGFITQHATELLTEEERLQQAREDDVVTAQRLTVGLLDLMAAIGLPSENLARIVLALGQVRAHGRLLAQEIRQMVNAGVGLDIMAMAMGMTVEEFMNAQKEGQILAEDFLPALVRLLEEDLAGAADRVMNTFGGAILSLQKFREVGLRTFFGPLFESITPGLRRLADTLTSQKNLDRIEKWGNTFRDKIWEIYADLITLYKTIESYWTILQKEGKIELAIAVSGDLFGEGFGKTLDDFVEAVRNFNIELGFVDGNAAAAEGALGGLAALFIGSRGFAILKRIGPAILGIILGIGSGIGWIGVVAGLLGAAWAGNWLGIRDKLKEVYEGYIVPKFGDFIGWLQEKIPLAIQETKKWWSDKLWPALKEVWGWIEENIIPTLVEWGRILMEEVTQGIKNVVKWIRDKLIPKLIEVRDWMVDEVTPAFLVWVEDVVPKIEAAAGDVRTAFEDDVIPGLQAVVDYITDDALPKLRELGGWFSDESKWSFSRFNDVWKKWIVPTFTSIGEIVGPTIEEGGALHTFIGLFESMGDDVFPTLKQSWDSFMAPIFVFLGTWTKENVVPVVDELHELFKNLLQVVTDLGGDAWSDLMLAFVGLGQALYDPINKRVNDFYLILHNIWEVFFVQGISQAMENLTQTVLPAFAGAFEKLAIPLNTVRDLLDVINRTLADLLGLEPEGLLSSNSPPLLALIFDAISESISEADETLRNSVFAQDGLGIGRLTPGALSFGPGGVGAAPVVIEGDTNTFIVPDQATAAFVAHQIEESKKRRYSEYMGRV